MEEEEEENKNNDDDAWLSPIICCHLSHSSLSLIGRALCF